MSIHNSYFNRNNTIVYNSYTNTGRKPDCELFFGSDPNVLAPIGFSRFIFNLDLTLLLEKIQQGTISTGCTTAMTHTLMMKNLSSFDNNIKGDRSDTGRLRATSFDLMLFRIPNTSGSTGAPQNWDEGVGYDYFKTIQGYPRGELFVKGESIDKTFSTRPSNWFQTTTVSSWSEPGLYNNLNNGNVNYSGLTVIGTQHFEFGDEDLSIDMSSEINLIINGELTGSTGYGIAYLPDVENISGLTENYYVGFFTRHTQTFYEPYLLTSYNDLIQDDRNQFSQLKQNNLYLYTYLDGEPIILDQTPLVSILDPSGNPISGYTGLTTCLVTEGVYQVIIPALSGYSTPCQFTDIWSNLIYQGVPLNNIENEFILSSFFQSFNLGIQSKDPVIYGFDYYGIKQDEQILNTDLRKVGVIIKKAFTAEVMIKPVNALYRVYVMEGPVEIQVQEWTAINRTTNEYYFIFDTRDKIPNEYFIDIQVTSSGQVNTFKRQIKFQIVSKL